MLDRLLDRTLVGGYSRLGYLVRHRTWTGAQADPAPGALAGHTALVTGAGGGLGAATAAGLARLGARVHVLTRSRERSDEACARLAAEVPGGAFVPEACDIGELSAVRAFAADLRERVPALHLLVHNAGVLPPERTETGDGNELTLAVHVLGPHLLTGLLREPLTAAAGRVLLVSSGGMYAQRLAVDDPQFRQGRYGGTAAYARTKRMQVELARVWADELAGTGVLVHSLHPGWAATPGLTGSLPGFDRVVRSLLRTPEQGADTAVWLAAAPADAIGTGRFWHDRTPRPEHYLARTRPSDDDRARFRALLHELVPDAALRATP